LQHSLLWIVLAATVLPAPAQIILQVTSGTGTAAEFFGQSFTTPAGGPWSGITFNFYSTPAVGATPASTPVAAGTAFLLTREYLGTPAALSTSTPGFLAQSISIFGGVYAFPPSVVLNPGTEYWIYENASITITGNGTGGSPAGAAYFAATANTSFSLVVPSEEIANYRLGADEFGLTPVPPSFLLTAAALLCVGLYQARRRFARQG